MCVISRGTITGCLIVESICYYTTYIIYTVIVCQGSTSTSVSKNLLGINHGNLGLSDQKYHPETSLTFPAWQYWLGINKPKMSLV